MNQILCGDTVIDTDDVQLAIKIKGEDAQRRVFLRGNRTAILRGEEEAAFDVWAATLPRSGELADERREGEQDDDVHGWTPPPEARRLVDTEPRYGTGMAEPTGLAQGQGVPESPTP